jgi:hypothetical protein
MSKCADLIAGLTAAHGHRSIMHPHMTHRGFWSLGFVEAKHRPTAVD